MYLTGLKLRHQQGFVPFGDSKGASFFVFTASGGCGHSLIPISLPLNFKVNQVSPLSSLFCSHIFLSPQPGKVHPLLKTYVISLGPSDNPELCLLLSLLNSVMQTNTLTVLELRLLASLGDHYSPDHSMIN